MVYAHGLGNSCDKQWISSSGVHTYLQVDSYRLYDREQILLSIRLPLSRDMWCAFIHRRPFSLKCDAMVFLCSIIFLVSCARISHILLFAALRLMYDFDCSMCRFSSSIYVSSRSSEVNLYYSRILGNSPINWESASGEGTLCKDVWPINCSCS